MNLIYCAIAKKNFAKAWFWWCW